MYTYCIYIQIHMYICAIQTCIYIYRYTDVYQQEEPEEEQDEDDPSGRAEDRTRADTKGVYKSVPIEALPQIAGFWDFVVLPAIANVMSVLNHVQSPECTRRPSCTSHHSDLSRGCAEVFRTQGTRSPTQQEQAGHQERPLQGQEGQP